MKRRVDSPDAPAGPFLMSVEDVFSISGRGTVATGPVERGTIAVGDQVELVGLRETSSLARLTGIEMFQRSLGRATAGDDIGVLLGDLPKEQVERGMVLAMPGTIAATKAFAAELRLESSYSRMPESAGDSRLSIQIRAALIKGEVSFANDQQRLLPGESARVTVRLERPIAILPNLQVRVFDGSRTLAVGRALGS